jgi:predicted nucleotidyltransferase
VELPIGSDPLAADDLGAELEALLKVHVDVLSTRVARPEVLEQALRDAVPV